MIYNNHRVSNSDLSKVGEAKRGHKIMIGNKKIIVVYFDRLGPGHATLGWDVIHPGVMRIFGQIPGHFWFGSLVLEIRQSRGRDEKAVRKIFALANQRSPLPPFLDLQKLAYRT
jgi:hypothetical protein